MPEKKIVYIGEFPPAYGGVTVKNAILYEQVFRDMGAQMIDLERCRRLPLEVPATLFRIVNGMIRAQSVIIGTGAVWRDKFLLILQRILTGKRGMKKITKFVMGGRYHEFVRRDAMLHMLLKDVGSIWVESKDMIRALQKMGIEQVYFFPNCRKDEGAREPRPIEKGIELKLVFFSRICEEKGVEIVMKAFERLRAEKASVSLDFYGEISSEIKKRFEEFVGGDFVRYHGVFDAVNGDIYKELNQYDIILLPTRWEGEGVPGVLVESKMAGIAAIVSNWHANSEVVRDGQEGIVLASPFADSLADVIKELADDRDRVQRLKWGAYESRKRYCIEMYRRKLIEKIHR